MPGIAIYAQLHSYFISITISTSLL